ncbi:MAG: lamin tail domain-containing protein [Bacteroidales bacterium]|nr:lamin tail domain-containing protein [Bacteroidales bacterium]
MMKAMALNQSPDTRKVRIISALVDPAGVDTGKENISILNTNTTNIDLAGWAFDVKGKKQALSVALAGGEARTIKLTGSVKLANNGATISLLNAQQEIVHTVSYQKKQVKKGVIIQF